MRIGFDVDGVLADFNAAYIDKVIEVTGQDRFPARPFDIPTWEYPEYYGYTHEQVSAVWRRIKQSEVFWAMLPPYKWTQDTLERLHRARHAGHDIYFVTSRPGTYAKLQTEHWLHFNGFDEGTVLICSNKGAAVTALDLETYIDDKVENCQDVAKTLNDHRFKAGHEQGRPTFILDQPWNRVSIAPFDRCLIERITSPLEMLDKVLAI